MGSTKNLYDGLFDWFREDFHRANFIENDESSCAYGLGDGGYTQIFQASNVYTIPTQAQGTTGFNMSENLLLTIERDEPEALACAMNADFFRVKTTAAFLANP